MVGGGACFLSYTHPVVTRVLTGAAPIAAHVYQETTLTEPDVDLFSASRLIVMTETRACVASFNTAGALTCSRPEVLVVMQRAVTSRREIEGTVI